MSKTLSNINLLLFGTTLDIQEYLMRDQGSLQRLSPSQGELVNNSKLFLIILLLEEGSTCRKSTTRYTLQMNDPTRMLWSPTIAPLPMSANHQYFPWSELLPRPLSNTEGCSIIIVSLRYFGMATHMIVSIEVFLGMT